MRCTLTCVQNSAQVTNNSMVPQKKTLHRCLAPALRSSCQLWLHVWTPAHSSLRLRGVALVDARHTPPGKLTSLETSDFLGGPKLPCSPFFSRSSDPIAQLGSNGLAPADTTALDMVCKQALFPLTSSCLLMLL